MEVIVPSYTVFATVTPLLQLNNCNIKIKFADCLLENGNIDPQRITHQINDKTKALIITHMWGISCNLNEIIDICNDQNILLLQDCSHAHGTTYNSVNVGNYGDGNAWSLQGKKLITAGEGGILCTKHQDIFEKAVLIGHYNKRSKQQIDSKENLEFASTGTGLKLRMHPLGCALANEQLKNDYFVNMVKERQDVGHYISHQIQTEHIFNGLSPAMIPDNSTSSFYALPILFDHKQFKCSLSEFVYKLNECGVSSADVPNSTCPLHYHHLFQQLIHNDDSNADQFKNAQQFHQSMFKIDVAYGPNRLKYADYVLNALEYVCNATSIVY
eukprot:745861_1